MKYKLFLDNSVLSLRYFFVKLEKFANGRFKKIVKSQMADPRWRVNSRVFFRHNQPKKNSNLFPSALTEKKPQMVSSIRPPPPLPLPNRTAVVVTVSLLTFSLLKAYMG